MGNSKSNLKVTARVTVQCECCPVDSITLSYERRRSSCGGRRRLVAAFTFPRHGWRQVSSEDTRHNISSKAAVVSLDRLRKKDGGRAVEVICLSGGVPVYRTEVTVADLLQRLDLTTRGKEAAVFFSLSGGKTEEGNTHFTALFFNGSRCGDGGAATPADTLHPTPCPVQQVAKDRLAANTEDAIFWAFDAGNNSAWTCEDDGEDEKAMGEDDNGMEQEEDAVFHAFDEANNSCWTCEDDGNDEEAMGEDDNGMEPEEEEEEKQDEVIESPPRHCGDRRTPTRLQGWRGSSVMDSLGYIAGVAAVMLVWYNAWQEYTSH